jgi:bifunctional UDP-N-acetylglucosamine pyrophosphorylase/glucosamine-1-phosphate N-acetyltransferase
MRSDFCGHNYLHTSIIILAAGQGKRMHSAQPKVLQSLAGMPLLQHVVDCAGQLDATDMCVVYGHGGDAVQAAFAHEDIRWVLQEEQNGTGHAVQQAMPGTPDDSRVVVLYGDVPLLRAETIGKLVSACDPGDVAVLTVELDDPFGYGRIVRRDGAVVKSVEERDATGAEREITEINSGVMCFPAGKLKHWLSQLKNDNTQGEYYLTDVVGIAVADGVVVHGVKTNDRIEIMGINDKKQLADAERAMQLRRADDLMEQGVSLADPSRIDIRGNLTCGRDVYIDINAVIEGDVQLGDNVRVESNNVIRNSEIGSGTVIRPNCHIEGATVGSDCNVGPFARLRPGATLGNNVGVGNFVEIKKSTIGAGSKVNHLTYLGDTTVGRDVNVGAGTITCNYDGLHKHQTIIGDGAFIGSGVELVAPVEVGKGATIGAGSTISKPVPAGKLTLERARQLTVPGWKAPKRKV